MKTETHDMLFDALVDAKRRERRARHICRASWVVLGLLGAAVVAALCALVWVKQTSAREATMLEFERAGRVYLAGGVR